MKALQILQTILMAGLLWGFWVNSNEVSRISGKIDELSNLTVRLANLEGRVAKIEEKSKTP